MTTLMTVLGWACTLGLILLLILIAGDLLFVLLHKLLRLYGDRIENETRQRVGAELGSDAWWFSESPDTSNAMRLYAQTLVTGSSPGISQLRDEWRKMATADKSTADYAAKCDATVERIGVLVKDVEMTADKS